MELYYNTVESTVEPASIEINADSVYLRHSVVPIIRRGVRYYIYKEAVVSVEDFNKYANQIILENQMAADNTTGELLLSQMEMVGILEDLDATLADVLLGMTEELMPIEEEEDNG